MSRRSQVIFVLVGRVAQWCLPGLLEGCRKISELKAMFDNIRGVLWCPGPAEGELPELNVAQDLVVLVESLAPAQAPERRTVYIRKLDLKRFGYTFGCAGSSAAQDSEACRARIETATGSHPAGEQRVAIAEIEREVAQASILTGGSSFLRVVQVSMLYRLQFVLKKCNHLRLVQVILFRRWRRWRQISAQALLAQAQPRQVSLVPRWHLHLRLID